jgi:demethylmenaquinone methyltransferase / 2-methoxy-6-polyprenyl-1,4-benzoquinol methylase
MSSRIQEMFNNIASDYDKMNKVMTFGMDKYWRRYVVKQSAVGDDSRLLDLATGTGDIIFEALKKYSPDVTGLDFSDSMLKIARARDIKKRARWIQADALNLPFENNSFDAVTSGYLMRNVGDIQKAFEEQYRVLKSGGKVVCLDTTPPGKNIIRPFIRIYLKMIIPLMGKILTGNLSAYAYLTESTVNFKSADEIKAIMISTGFSNVIIKKFMFGTIAVHSAEK